MNRCTVSSGQRAAGFSLIELMVAMVAGMIVVGAVLTFTISSIRSNSEFVRSTRLMQELRNSMDHISSELRRAGYDEAAMAYVANASSTAVSKFAPMRIDTAAGSECIIYAYDRQPGTQGVIDVANGEIRAIRRRTATPIAGGPTVGVIEVAESTSTVTPACNGAQPDYAQFPVVCNTASGWCPLSDPRSINVESLVVNVAGSGNDSNGVRDIAGGAAFNAIRIRELQVTLRGSLVSDPAASREVRSNIRVRADCVRPNLSSCSVAPTP